VSLTIVTTITPTSGFTQSDPQNLRQLALARTNINPGPFDVVGITLPRLQNDTSGLQTVTANGFFHTVGGVLRLNLVQEVVISNALSPCQQTVVLQHERGHVRDNEAIMPLMDHALRQDEEFNLILVQGQEFPVAMADAVKENLRERIEAVFSGLTEQRVQKRDTLIEYKRMNTQMATQCGGRTAPYLSMGSVGHGVAEAQIALNAHLPLGQEVLTVDGIFGLKTRRVTIAFQSTNGLNPDGIIGPKTREKLGLPPIKAAGRQQGL
jgi:peptidoglycan hydrolase-like protein with peptidoglycan-binding domain